MKTIAKLLFAIIIIIGGMTVSTKYFSGEIAGIIDRANPLIQTGEIYVKTTEPQSVNEYGSAAYKQEAVDAEGNTRTIEFTGMSKLKKDHYLKLKNKGAYVETYEEVAKEDVPTAALKVIG